MITPGQLSAQHTFNAINWDLDTLPGSVAICDNDWTKALLQTTQPAQYTATTQTGTEHDWDPSRAIERGDGACHEHPSPIAQRTSFCGSDAVPNDTCEDDRLAESPQAVQRSCETRRAKNRLAATKCRAKQKVRRDGLQTEFRSMSAQNKRLKREERLLRDAIAFLRDCALQHDATRCNCDSLHRFNLKRAECISLDMSFCKPGALK